MLAGGGAGVKEQIPLTKIEWRVSKNWYNCSTVLCEKDFFALVIRFWPSFDILILELSYSLLCKFVQVYIQFYR